MTSKPGNSKLVKKINRMVVINVIKNNEPISRNQLAKVIGLTPPAITGIVKELLECGLIEEIGLGKSEGGRRPMKLRFNRTAGYVIGIEVMSGEAIVSIADLKSAPQVAFAEELSMKDTCGGIKALTEIIQKTMAIHNDKRFLGVGVAFPGLLDVKNGTVRRSINLGSHWNGFPLKDVLESKIGLPVFIENNSNASVLTERCYGGTECKDMVYVNLGEGISAGIILGDRILQGFHGYAGEIGHIVLDEGGPLCNCGNRGCLEAICAIPALLTKVMAELPLVPDSDRLKKAWHKEGQISFTQIVDAANAEAGYARELLTQVGKKIGLAVADIINLYNPELIFIGGKMAAAHSSFIDAIKGAVKMHAFPEIAAETTIERSRYGENSASFGACALILNKLLQSEDSPIFNKLA